MAGPITAVNDIFAVTWDSLYKGQQVLTTMHLMVTGVTSSPPDLETTYAGLRTYNDALGGPGASYAALFSDRVTDIKFRIQKIYPARWAQSVGFSNPATGSRVAGTSDNPPNVAGSLTLRSLIADPHGRSNLHILATNPADVANGELSEEFTTLLNDFGTAVLGLWAVPSPEDVVAYHSIAFNRANPVLSMQHDTRSVNPHSRVMRRRTVGQGS